jgi:hypothetical protein
VRVKQRNVLRLVGSNAPASITSSTSGAPADHRPCRRRIKRATLLEISLVSVPANLGCRIVETHVYSRSAPPRGSTASPRSGTRSPPRAAVRHDRRRDVPDGNIPSPGQLLPQPHAGDAVLVYETASSSPRTARIHSTMAAAAAAAADRALDLSQPRNRSACWSSRAGAPQRGGRHHVPRLGSWIL